MNNTEAISNALTDHIVRTVGAADGWIDFGRFIDCALYTPELGYYENGRTIFGAKGDFMTAPHYGDLFARTLAYALIPLLAQYDTPRLVEIGGGNGALAVDLYRAFRDAGRHVHYDVLEKSATLRKVQAARFQSAHITDIRHIALLPKDFCGVIFANEVVDALPARCIILEQDKSFELGVAVRNGTLYRHAIPAPKSLLPAINAIRCHTGTITGRYMTELRPDLATQIAPWCQNARNAHFVCIDYGYPAAVYYHPDRTMGTLLCYGAHRAHDNPLAAIGCEDISVHVDFDALTVACRAHGFMPLFNTTQARFLFENDIVSLANTGNIHKQDALHRLISPEHMGEVFRVACYRKYDKK